MRRIPKGAEPNILREANARGVHYDDWDGKLRTAIRAALHAEQNGVCAYCERPVRVERSDDVSRMVVIEHFHPRSGSPRTGKWKSSQCRAASGATSHESSRTAWSNLLLSCDGSGPHGARTCDSKKGGSDICSRFANPKTTHLDRLVDIGRDGRARPVDSLPPGADAVVDSELNLNAEFLCEARRSYFAVQLREYNKAKTRHRGLSSVQKQILVNRFRERASRPGTPHPSVLLAVANSIEAKI